jgi:hypothetical protein
MRNFITRQDFFFAARRSPSPVIDSYLLLRASQSFLL